MHMQRHVFMDKPKRGALIALFCLALLACSGRAYAEMRIFTLEHKPAAEIAEVVRALVSDGAKVATHRNTLVVNTSPAELEEIARLVAEYDQPVRMLRVTVEQSLRETSRSHDLGASGRISSGSVVIGAGQPRRQPGNGSIIIQNDQGRVRLQGQDRSVTESRSAQQFMVVMEGSPAVIRVGQRVPFTSELYFYSRRHPHFVEVVEYQNVDTGFEVLPVVQGDRVELEISPFMAFLDRDNPNRIVFHDLVTRVRVPLGAWYDLGGQVSTSDGLSREILRTGVQSGQEENSLRVRVDPEM